VVNLKLFIERFKPGVDPFSGDNIVVLGTGPLTGTIAPCSTKLIVTTKLPHTGTVASCSSGGVFARAMKFAGYDHIIIEGRCEKPSYIEILDDHVEICDAKDIWGKDIFEATKWLWRKYHRDEYSTSCGVICIGQAGEKLVSYSICLVDLFAHLGKGGLGAVFGSKNLKAIIVRGAKDVRVADSERFMDIVRRVIERIRNDKVRESFTKWGILIGWEYWAKSGQIYWKNYSEAYPAEKAISKFGVEVHDKYKVGTVGCPSCLEPCKAYFNFNGIELYCSEYFSMILPFGCKLDTDIINAAKLFHKANAYGIDSFEVSGILEFLIEVCEKGLVDKEKVFVDRNPETWIRLIDDIVNRRGIGEVLADGWNRIFNYFGKDLKKYAVIYKGTSPVFDVRTLLSAEAFGHITNPRGWEGPVQITVIPGRSVDTIKRFLVRIGCPDDAIDRIFRDGVMNTARYTKWVEDYLYMLNCLGICRRESSTRFYTTDELAILYTAATGIEITSRELLMNGERAWNLERICNFMEGYRDFNQWFQYPERIFEPLIFEGKKLEIMDYHKRRRYSKDEFIRLLFDYCDERGWNLDTGAPTKETLSKLGLDEYLRFLEG